MKPVDFFVAVSGVFWLVAYVGIIRQAFHDRSFCMPFAALIMNITWEFMFSFLYPGVGGNIQEVFNILWFCLDVVILYTYIRYWRSDYPKNLPANWMIPTVALSLAVTAAMMIAIIQVFGKESGSVYTAYGDNLVMSIVFITMLIRRGDRRGQSMLIAWSKLIGTAAASVSQLLDHTNPIWNVMFVAIFVFDVIYVYMLWKAPAYIPTADPASAVA